jgi:hypothetical protein
MVVEAGEEEEEGAGEEAAEVVVAGAGEVGVAALRQSHYLQRT